MSNIRVSIDLNDVDADGLTSVLLADVPGDVLVGNPVTAYEPEDHVEAPAEVVRIDEQYGLVFIRVDWHAMRSYTPAIAGLRLLISAGKALGTAGRASGVVVRSIEEPIPA